MLPGSSTTKNSSNYNHSWRRENEWLVGRSLAHSNLTNLILSTVPQILSILSSFLSMAWCIASYHRCIRFSQVDKANISWWGTIMQWLCHFLVSGLTSHLSICIDWLYTWTRHSFSFPCIVDCCCSKSFSDVDLNRLLCACNVNGSMDIFVRPITVLFSDNVS